MVAFFENLIVWQKAQEFTITVYGTFADTKDYGFRDQIQRASISIMNNISEGYGRHSDKAFRHFLLIARGSASEVKSMLYVVENWGMATTKQFLLSRNK